MDLGSFNQLDYIELPKLSYILLTIVIVYIGQLVEGQFSRNKREKITAQQRDLYYKRLIDESLKMECQKLKDELQSVQTIESLLNEGESVKNELGAVASYDVISDEDNEDESSNDDDSDRIKDKLNLEVEQLQEKVNEMKKLDREIVKLETRQHGNSTQTSIQKSPEALKKRIEQLQSENEELKKRIAAHDHIPIVNNTSKLDQDKLKFLETHNDRLTLEFLERAYESLIKFRASNPGKDICDHIAELKGRQKDYATELAELKVDEKEVEIKLDMTKERYLNELASFNDKRIEYLFKNSGLEAKLEEYKRKNIENEERLQSLKEELEQTQEALTKLMSDYKAAEEQSSVYFTALNKVKLERYELEAEQTAQKERERQQIMNQSNMLDNMSSASSMISTQLPPPPPINVAEEMSRIMSRPGQHEQSIGFQGYVSGNSSIPPPPPVEMSLNGYYGQDSVRSSSSGDGHGTSRSQRGVGGGAKVGGRYGTILNPT